jgi:Ca-activated chloride channel family protein
MKNLVIIILLVPVLGLNAQYVKREIRKGNKEYNKAAYGESEIHYRKALEKDPESENANYNLGNALYKQNQFEPAITKYESLTGKETNPKKLSAFYYNLGNSYFKSQKLDKCIEAYKQSLRLNPKDADAKHNLYLAQNMQKQQQKQQQQQNQDNKNKDQKDKNKDKQKQDQNKQHDKNQQQSQKDQQKQQDKQDQQKNDQKQQISKQDAERLLEAMEQDEKNVMKKVQDQKAQVRKIPVEKEW